jgi:hypothetical protein
VEDPKGKYAIFSDNEDDQYGYYDEPDEDYQDFIDTNDMILEDGILDD